MASVNRLPTQEEIDNGPHANVGAIPSDYLTGESSLADIVSEFLRVCDEMPLSTKRSLRYAELIGFMRKACKVRS